jgi:hypothetical protein
MEAFPTTSRADVVKAIGRFFYYSSERVETRLGGKLANLKNLNRDFEM